MRFSLLRKYCVVIATFFLVACNLEQPEAIPPTQETPSEVQVEPHQPDESALPSEPTLPAQPVESIWEACDFGKTSNETPDENTVLLEENTASLFGEEYPASCGANTSESPTYGVKSNIIVNLKLCSENLIKNPFFKMPAYGQSWTVSNWQYDHIYGSSTPFSLINDEHSFFGFNYIQIKNNSAGRHFITQTVAIEANKHYIANVLYELPANDYRNAGLFIYRGDELIAKKTSSLITKNPELLSLDFLSEVDEEITVKIGFDDNGINSELRIFYVELVEEENSNASVKYATTPKQFVERCVNWNQTTLNSSISDITDYALSVLGNPDAEERASFQQKYSPYLTSWLSEFLDQYTYITHRSSFCQAASLSAAEITSLFGTRTRQWHWTGDDGTGQHQFFEYLNPETNKWIIVDPYYSIQYASGGELLGVEDVLRIGIDNVDVVEMTSRVIFPQDPSAIHGYFSEGSLVQGLHY